LVWFVRLFWLDWKMVVLIRLGLLLVTKILHSLLRRCFFLCLNLRLLFTLVTFVELQLSQTRIFFSNNSHDVQQSKIANWFLCAQF
jgi:hypothetical protein